MPESSSSAHAQPWNGSTKFASPATLRMFSWMNRKQRKSLPLSYWIVERETGIEPATSSLGSWRSTAELLPLVLVRLSLARHKGKYVPIGSGRAQAISWNGELLAVVLRTGW